MKSDVNADTVCDCARALSVVGDRWTLLIMRELTLGVRKFEEIQALTGMSSHLLSARLKRMEMEKLVQRKQYSSRPARYEYHATLKGKGLDPVVLALRAWSLKWVEPEAAKEPAVKMIHKKSGEVIDADWRIPPGENFTFDDVEAQLSPDFLIERDMKIASFRSGKHRSKDVAPGSSRASSKFITPVAVMDKRMSKQADVVRKRK